MTRKCVSSQVAALFTMHAKHFNRRKIDELLSTAARKAEMAQAAMRPRYGRCRCGRHTPYLPLDRQYAIHYPGRSWPRMWSMSGICGTETSGPSRLSSPTPDRWTASSISSPRPASTTMGIRRILASQLGSKPGLMKEWCPQVSYLELCFRSQSTMPLGQHLPSPAGSKLCGS